MLSPRLLAALVAAAALGAACGSGPQAGGSDGRCAGEGVLCGHLVITGSSTVAPLVAEIARRFEARHPGVRIDVQAGGSARGLADARRGLADIGMVSRSLTPVESDLRPVAIARDGVGIITHSSNPLDSLTREQLVAIYTGALMRWSELGGEDAPITLVHKAEGRSTLEVFLDYLGVANHRIEPDVVIGDNEQGIKTVAANPTAVGYVSVGAAEHAVSAGAAIKLLRLGGVEASVASVARGSFPMARPLTLVTRPEPAPVAAAFLEFAASAAVAELVRGQYFVPLSG